LSSCAGFYYYFLDLDRRRGEVATALFEPGDVTKPERVETARLLLRRPSHADPGDALCYARVFE